MAIIICPNRHYYDNSKYKTCPVCSSMNAGMDLDGSNPTEAYRTGDEKTLDFPGGFEDPGLQKDRTARPKRMDERLDDDLATESFYSFPHDRVDQWREDDSVTEPLYNPGQRGNPRRFDEKPTEPGHSPREHADEWQGDDNPTEPLIYPKHPADKREEDDNVTIPFYGGRYDDRSTVAPHPGRPDDRPTRPLSHQQTRPVVGWLVCIEGSFKGRSFNLYPGKNFIGRTEENDISIAGDQSVSRKRHAIVVFEPRSRMFYASTGESSSLFYVNGENVRREVNLKDRDMIEIGRNKFIFVAFCTESFCWDI